MPFFRPHQFNFLSLPLELLKSILFQFFFRSKIGYWQSGVILELCNRFSYGFYYKHNISGVFAMFDLRWKPVLSPTWPQTIDLSPGITFSIVFVIMTPGFSQDMSRKIISESFEVCLWQTHLHEKCLLFSFQLQAYLVVSHSDSLWSFFFVKPKYFHICFVLIAGIGLFYS